MSKVIAIFSIVLLALLAGGGYFLVQELNNDQAPEDTSAAVSTATTCGNNICEVGELSSDGCEKHCVIVNNREICGLQVCEYAAGNCPADCYDSIIDDANNGGNGDDTTDDTTDEDTPSDDTSSGDTTDDTTNDTTEDTNDVEITDQTNSDAESNVVILPKTGINTDSIFVRLSAALTLIMAGILVHFKARKFSRKSK